MANEVAYQGICTVSLDSGGVPIVIKFEEPGSFQFTLPAINKRFVQDRGVNTSTQVVQPEEQVTFSFTCDEIDDQEIGDLWASLDGTNDVTFVIAYTGGSITHTFKYCQASADGNPDEAGRTTTLTATAQGWTDGTNTYGLQA